MHLAISDVFVSPHVHKEKDMRFFGSPTKIFEYMAMGRAILASRLEQIADILAPGLDARDGVPTGAEASVLFTPGDEDGFLLGLKRLVEQPTLREQLGKRARAKVLAEYTWDRYARQVVDRLSAVARR